MAVTLGKGFVAVDMKTGKAVAEFFDFSLADRINTDRYKIVPILEYLGSLNKNEHPWHPNQPRRRS